jgi:plasmid stabilization system protein ParE
MQLKFRTAASADMRRIARTTRDIKSLCEFPLRFPEFASRPGLNRMNSGRRAVFYLVLEERIEIVRVLHGASDVEQWLG